MNSNAKTILNIIAIERRNKPKSLTKKYQSKRNWGRRKRSYYSHSKFKSQYIDDTKDIARAG